MQRRKPLEGVHVTHYSMEYYSAIEKEKIMPFATTWMDPEGIMLREVVRQ